MFVPYKRMSRLRYARNTRLFHPAANSSPELKAELDTDDDSLSEVLEDWDPQEPHDDPDDNQESDVESSEDDDMDGSTVFGDDLTGWTVRDICALLIHTAKKHGVADKTLNQFLQIMYIMVSCKRAASDSQKFPRTVPSLLRLIGISPASHYKTVFICPKLTYKRKRNEEDLSGADVCGFTLREEVKEQKEKYKCDSCGSVWDKKTVNRDGCHFVTVEMRTLLSDVMQRLGRTAIGFERHGRYEDFVDGTRSEEMAYSSDDLPISIHGDGAAISKSTKKKAYFMFVRPLNLPIAVRRCMWLLHSLWIGEHLPKDRECFLLETSKQLGKLRNDSTYFEPIKWLDISSQQRQSQVSDTPERNALSGGLSHTALQGCLYCTQVAESMNKRACYRYDPTVLHRTHAEVMKVSDQWPDLSAKDRSKLIKTHQTHGLKRPSLISTWKSFDMVKGFAIDIMHALDEGVSKWMLAQLIDPEVSHLNLSRVQRKHMDKMWLSMRVPSHENRRPRSLTQYNQFKAHEIRMFVLHAIPVVTKGILPCDSYKLCCLLSTITWICSADKVTTREANQLKDYCDKFMRSFEEIFGVEHMKYSVHLVSHLHLALQYYGPLSTVSCYGPENQIGKITRNIQSMSNTTKHLMNNYTILNQSSILLATVAGELSDKANDRVQEFAVMALGGVGCYLPAASHSCRNYFYGKAVLLSATSPEILKTQLTEDLRKALTEGRLVSFAKAMVNSGIFVRPHRSDGNFLDIEQIPSCSRNSSVVCNQSGECFLIRTVVAVMDKNFSRVERRILLGERLPSVLPPDDTFIVGSRKVKCEHFGLLSKPLNLEYTVMDFCEVLKHIFLLRQTDGVVQYSTPPSVWRIT